MTTFLQLYLAHLLAAFVLRPGRRARSGSGRWAAEAGTRLLLGCGTLNLALERRSLLALGALAAAQASVGLVAERQASRRWLALAATEAAQFLAAMAAALWLTSGRDLLGTQIQALLASPRLYFYLTAYVGVVFAGGAVVQQVMLYFMRNIDLDLAILKPGLPSAGQYIGWLERAVTLTLVLWGPAEAIGFLLAAKALVRYPEIQEDRKGHFAEYFLLGTLTSVGLALLGGLFAVRVRTLL